VEVAWLGTRGGSLAGYSTGSCRVTTLYFLTRKWGFHLRCVKDDAPPVIIIFYKNPPSISILPRSSPSDLKIKITFFSPATRVRPSRQSSPSLGSSTTAPSRRAGALFLLGSPGRWGAEELPHDSTCPRPPPPPVLALGPSSGCVCDLVRLRYAAAAWSSSRSSTT
jgi:hypothetical protein